MLRESRISAYLPCYNVARFLPTTIVSLQKQSQPLSEILIVDDGSTDSLEEIAKRFDVMYIRHSKNMGLAAARNTAIKNSSCDFIASIDSDCSAEETWAEKLMKHFSSKEVVGVGGRTIETNCVTYPDKWRCRHMKQDWGDQIVTNPRLLFGSNTILRKSVLTSVGGYDERFRTNGEDVDISKRILSSGGRLVYDPHATVYHRRKDTFYTVSKTYWNWNNPLIAFENQSALLSSLALETGRAMKIARNDFKDRELWATLMAIGFWSIWIKMRIDAWKRGNKTRCASKG